MLKTFIANIIKLLIERPQLDFFVIDSLESEDLAADNQISKSVLNQNTLSPTI